jgi:hypothetical protein
MPKTGIPARDPFNLAPQLGFLAFSCNPATEALAAGKLKGTLPAGALVLGSFAITETVLAGGAPALSFGTTAATATELRAAASFNAANAISALIAPNTLASFGLRLANDTPIFAKETGAATSGLVHLVIVYVKLV